MTLDDLRTVLDPAVRRAGFEAWKASLVELCFYSDRQDVSFDCHGPIESVGPLTAYGDEPNHYRMCKRHADDYREHWSEMWRDYYGGCL